MGVKLIHQIDYDKISDDLYHLGNRVIVRLNVLLSKKDVEGNRSHYHREYRYDSKYKDYDKVINIKRSFDYHLSFDKVDDFNVSVMIRIQDMMLLKMKLQEVANIFNSGIYTISKKGDLKIIKKPKPIILDGLVGGKYIAFEFIVLEDEITKIQQQGVRITLTDPNIFCDISIDRFYGLYYTISQLNLFQSAQIMINYLGNPGYGTSLTDFEKPTFQKVVIDDTPEPNIEIKSSRELPRPKSSFEQLDNM